MAQIWVDWVDCNPGLRHICCNNIILGPFIDYSRRISGILVGSATKMINEVAEVGPNKAASANVETVFSGAGKFSKDAEKSSADLLRRVVRLHYAWKYSFLRAPVAEIVNRYNAKYHPALHAMLRRQAEAAASSTEELLASAQGQAVAREEPEGEGAEADPEAA